ncbi:MAG: gamma-glutamyltransferase [Alphaproteobacteria bacterium]|jgi:gamma-glutamyltranspeptidase / glutathione hydrolase|nr:gamma-glutamyltransferase [Alphaproteobacteria bacterium]MBT4016912.1 gamma-glutamyltransferase [Alphaproteobacteria bacterium]MBT4964940.1 gamma-glutamyltransferase [Alphaproteobacteria bacterium]MBT5159820.1 gamma-glutamyltransferase [Alphaproteobacteria bacterium]MBT5917300.1 gamma-glutamyltransferase [Alphaproteobacteria bacterium]
MRDFHFPGRSTAHGMNGVAATSHPAATLAAIDILRAGGNAVDAAIAASATLCVVEPQSTGIGGDCFAVYAPGSDMSKAISVNGSGCAPAKANVDWFIEQGMDRIGLFTAHAVTVPGAVDAWDKLLKAHGTMKFDQVLKTAIDYAEDGFVVAPRVSKDWAGQVDKLSKDANASRVYLANGRAPACGEVHRNQGLAETFRTIAAEGRDGFYEGRVAKDIVDYLNSLGGLHTLDDFSAQETEILEPIQTSYRDYHISTVPPNNPGITTLIMLNILEGFDLASLDPNGTQRLHLQAEATRLAYNARETWVGDPRQVDVPVDRLLSKEFAEELRAQINPDQASDFEYIRPPAHPDTIYLSVVDKDRNAISFINSTFFPFGSGLVSPTTGIALQNRGGGFRLEPDHPNCIAPGKRPLHTITPGMLSKDGRTVMPYGVMGGQYQPVGQSQVVTNVVDFGMDPQEALDMPRAFHFDEEYQLESGVPAETEAGLKAMGHKTTRFDSPHGGGQAIWIDWENNTLMGGSDPRKDGIALGY